MRGEVEALMAVHYISLGKNEQEWGRTVHSTGIGDWQHNAMSSCDVTQLSAHMM